MADLSKDTLLFGKEFRRMCNSFWADGKYMCNKCVLYQGGCLFGAADECDENDEYILQVVQRWHNEHPLPKPKTYREDFLEKLPNTEVDEYGCPTGCRDKLYFGIRDCTACVANCIKCWDEPMEERK